MKTFEYRITITEDEGTNHHLAMKKAVEKFYSEGITRIEYADGSSFAIESEEIRVNTPTDFSFGYGEERTAGFVRSIPEGTEVLMSSPSSEIAKWTIHHEWRITYFMSGSSKFDGTRAKDMRGYAFSWCLADEFEDDDTETNAYLFRTPSSD